MDKQELITQLQDYTSESLGRGRIPKAELRVILEQLGELVSKRLVAGDEVILPGVGKLVTETRKARRARNPKTGESVEVPERRVVKIKPAKPLREKLASRPPSLAGRQGDQVMGLAVE